MDAETAHQEGLIHQLISSSSTSDISQSILPLLELETKALAAQKKMLRLASQHHSGNTDWADDIFESIWMNATHVKNLEAFRKR